MPLLACAALFPSGPALAQESQTLEITPFFGYQFGGDFEVFDSEFGVVDFEFEDSEVFGVAIDFPLNRYFQVEGLIFRQPSTLEIDEGIFGPAFELSDIDIDYFQANALWQGAWGQVKPYMSGGMGFAILSPDLPELDSETRFAFNFGAGVKTFFTPHVGLRLDSRLLFVMLPEDDEDVFCCESQDDGMSQVNFTLGVIFAF
jgi:hypothetical protein